MRPTQAPDIRGAFADLQTAVDAVRALVGPEPETPGVSDDEELVHRALRLLRSRRRLGVHLPEDLFADPAFDILLDLFVAYERNEIRTIKSVTIASRVPTTTALRYIGDLVKRGLVERRSDPSDGRIVLLRMSASARSGIRGWLAEGSVGASPSSRR